MRSTKGMKFYIFGFANDVQSFNTIRAIVGVTKVSGKKIKKKQKNNPLKTAFLSSVASE